MFMISIPQNKLIFFIIGKDVMKQLLFEFETKQNDEPLPFDEVTKEQVVAQIAHAIIEVYENIKKLEKKQ